MKSSNSIGQTLRRYIKLRGQTIQSVADMLEIKEKTFYDELQNDRISADLLLRLAVNIDIDLNWMLYTLGYDGHVSVNGRCQIPRMNSRRRNDENRKIAQFVTECLSKNPNSIADAKQELLVAFPLYYLLDVLLPEDCEIYIMPERDVEQYFIHSPHIERGSRGGFAMGGRMPATVIPGVEALSYILIEKEESKNERGIL